MVIPEVPGFASLTMLDRFAEESLCGAASRGASGMTIGPKSSRG
jgi:hypothetical protein